MAEYIGYLRGNRGQVSRLGSKSSGMVAEARGWNHGGSIALEVDGDIVLSLNGGSNSPGNVERVRISPVEFQRIQAGSLRLVLQPIDGGK